MRTSMYQGSTRPESGRHCPDVGDDNGCHQLLSFLGDLAKMDEQIQWFGCVLTGDHHLEDEKCRHARIASERTMYGILDLRHLIQ